MRPKILDNHGSSSLGFIVIWGIAASLVIAGLVFEDSFFQVGGTPVAKITNSVGKVTLRSEEQTNWKEAAPHQSFFDGDSVATAAGSQTKIQFSHGRSIEVAEESHITITAVKFRDDNHIIINLVNGAVAGSISGKSDYTLTILAGQQAFQLNHGENVGVKKVVGEKPKVVEPKKVLLSNYKKPDPPKAIVLPASFAAAVAEASRPDFKENGLAIAPISSPTPPPAAPAAKKEKPIIASAVEKPKSFETQLISPPTGKTWFTHSKFDKVASESISFQISPPTFKTITGWSFLPAVRIIPTQSNFKSDPQKGLYLTSQSANQTSFKVEVSKIMEAVPKTVDPTQVEVLSFSATGAAIAKSAKDETRSIGQNQSNFRMISLANLFQSTKPVKVSLEKLVTGNLKSGLFDAKANLSLTNAPIIIAVANAKSLAPYAASIDAGSTFGLSSLRNFEDKGIFIVKGKDIIAQIGGSLLTTELMEQIMKTMGGDFVFEGPRKSLVDLRGLSVAQAAEKLRSATAKSNQIYAVQGNQLIPLSKNFIETNDRVIRFVKGNSNALFLDKVSILVYR